MIDALIENIQNDKSLLQSVEAQMQSIKDERRAIVERLKESYADIHVFAKYMDETQQKKLDDLGLSEGSFSSRRTNPVVEKAFELICSAKDYKLTNQAWHEAYLKTLNKDEEQLSYTAFNIKCRSLFNTMKVLRTKGKDPSSSKDDVISLNGRPMKVAEDSKEDKSLEKAKSKKADEK